MLIKDQVFFEHIEDAVRDPHAKQYNAARDEVSRDPKRAILDIEKLSYDGSILGILYIADAMRKGWIYERDLSGAERWYLVAVGSGSLRGLHGLALTHLNQGKHDDAVKELSVAIENGYPPSMNSLASIYYYGIGVTVDKLLALNLWNRGASLKNISSLRNLSFTMMRGGFGIWRVPVGAYKFLLSIIVYIKMLYKDKYSVRLR